MNISVATSADRKYGQHAGVMIFSLLSNLSSDVSADIYILDGGIRRGDKKKILSLTKSFKARIYFVPAGDSSYKGYHLSFFPSRAIYYRLALGSLIPADVKKLLYLDSDILVRKDVSALWNTQLDINIIAGVNDPYVGFYEREYYKAYDLAKYINSGVLLIDMNAWRREGIGENARKLASGNQYMMPDQDAINNAVQGKVMMLDPKYNVMPPFFKPEEYGEFTQKYFSQDIVSRLRSEAVIVHFCGTAKPWHRDMKNPFTKEYWTYLKRSPWRDYEVPKAAYPSRHPSQSIKKYYIEKYVPYAIRIRYEALKSFVRGRLGKDSVPKKK